MCELLKPNQRSKEWDLEMWIIMVRIVPFVIRNELESYLSNSLPKWNDLIVVMTIKYIEKH